MWWNTTSNQVGVEIQQSSVCVCVCVCVCDKHHCCHHPHCSWCHGIAPSPYCWSWCVLLLMKWQQEAPQQHALMPL